MAEKIKESVVGARRPVGGRRNRRSVALHIVWCTYRRRPMVTEAVERAIYHCISAEAGKLGCQVLEINGMPDHVHVVLDLSATTSIANLLKQMKGVSSSLARQLLGSPAAFRWADGYAVFSLSRRHRDNAVRYVQNQKEHHAQATLRPAWEEAPDDTPVAERPCVRAARTAGTAGGADVVSA